MTSPAVGAYKAGIIESSDPRDGYNTASQQGNAIISGDQYRAKDGDKPGQDVNIQFRVSAQPGQAMLFVITEVRS